MSSVFSEQILADKLSKLNSTQQCIESILFSMNWEVVCVYYLLSLAFTCCLIFLIFKLVVLILYGVILCLSDSSSR